MLQLAIVTCLAIGFVAGWVVCWLVAYPYGIQIGRYREARHNARAQPPPEPEVVPAWAHQPALPQVVIMPVQALPSAWPSPPPVPAPALPAAEVS